MTYPGLRIGLLHVITDTTVQSRYSHAELSEMAIAGGADSIQLRVKGAGADAFAEIAQGVLSVCRRCGVPLIINDAVDVARTVGADGVHLGRGDMAIAEARAFLGPAAIIGGTAGSPDEAVEAERAGADYVGFGHVFPTTSKTKPGAPVGIDGVRAACTAVSMPVIAIGGITAARTAAIIEAGAWGVAVIGTVCAADSPREATAALRNAVNAGLAAVDRTRTPRERK